MDSTAFTALSKRVSGKLGAIAPDQGNKMSYLNDPRVLFQLGSAYVDMKDLPKAAASLEAGLSRATDPMQLALLIDNSAVSSAEVVHVREGLKAFVNTLGPQHHVSVVTYAERPTLVTSFSLDRGEVLRAVVHPALQQVVDADPDIVEVREHVGDAGTQELGNHAAIAARHRLEHRFIDLVVKGEDGPVHGRLPIRTTRPRGLAVMNLDVVRIPY